MALDIRATPAILVNLAAAGRRPTVTCAASQPPLKTWVMMAF